MLSSQRPSHFLSDPCPTPCSICPNRHDPPSIIQCDGPPSTKILFIGEKPAFYEDQIGRPFVGRSGEEYNTRYLPLAGLHRDEIMLTNSVRCAALNGGENPSKEQARICAAHHLPSLIAALPQLEYVVPMGGVAYSLVDETVRTVDVQHGYHFVGSILDGLWDGIIHPTLHPAAGLHKPQEIASLRDDFRRLGRLLNGEWLTPDDPYASPDYRDERADVDPALPWIAIDTEQDDAGVNGEWCLTWSQQPGTGYMLHVRSNLLRQFADRVNELVANGGRVYMHYAIHDRKHLLRFPVPIDIPWDSIVDTMMLAYHRNMPQGLKALAYRLCGVAMKDYDDTVRPYAEAKMFDYVQSCVDALVGEAAKKAWIQQVARDLAPPPIYKGKKVQQKHNDAWLDRVVGDYGLDIDNIEATQELTIWAASQMRWHPKGSTAPWLEIGDILKKRAAGFDVRPFDRWEKIKARRPEIMDDCRRLAGKKPSTGLSEVPQDEALIYACRDADTTGRVGMQLEEIEEIEQV